MNEKEYIKVCTEHRKKLYYFAVRYTHDSDQANDAVQDALIALWMHHTEKKYSEAKGFLIRVLYNHLVDEYRRERRHAEKLQAFVPDEVYSQFEQYELHDAVQQALDQLCEKERRIILLCDVEGYKYQEIAEITEMEASQVTGILYRSRIKFKKAYLALNEQHTTINNKYIETPKIGLI